MNLIRSTFLVFALALFCLQGMSQPRKSSAPIPDKNSTVLDSTGRQYSYQEWKSLVETRRYYLIPPKEEGAFSVFYLARIAKGVNPTPLEPKRPQSSRFFTTGKKFDEFHLKDLNKVRHSLSQLKGKVVVLNFWFINCGPCRAEMPHLNRVVQKFTRDDVVFIAVALDNKKQLEQFLTERTFLYNVVPGGRSWVNSLGVGSFPTHVVLDRTSKIVFHSSGYLPETIEWLERSITESLNPDEKSPDRKI